MIFETFHRDHLPTLFEGELKKSHPNSWEALVFPEDF